MSLLDTIKVGGISYAVKEVPYVEICGNRNYQGSCDYSNSKIEILSDISDERKQQTLIHELTHAIFYEAGYEEQDEDMVNRIGKVLHQVLEDNDFRASKMVVGSAKFRDSLIGFPCGIDGQER